MAGMTSRSSRIRKRTRTSVRCDEVWYVSCWGQVPREIGAGQGAPQEHWDPGELGPQGRVVQVHRRRFGGQAPETGTNRSHPAGIRGQSGRPGLPELPGDFGAKWCSAITADVHITGIMRNTKRAIKAMKRMGICHLLADTADG